MSVNKWLVPLHNKFAYVGFKEFKLKLAAILCKRYVSQTQTCPHKVKRAHLLTCPPSGQAPPSFCESEGLSSFAQLSPLADQTAQVWYYTSHVHVKSIRRNSPRQTLIAFAAECAIKNYYSFAIINASNKLEPSLTWVILSHNKDLILTQ